MATEEAMARVDVVVDRQAAFRELLAAQVCPSLAHCLPSLPCGWGCRSYIGAAHSCVGGETGSVGTEETEGRAGGGGRAC